MILSDRDIKAYLESGHIKITADYDVYADIQPASLDIRLGNDFKIYDHTKTPILDPRNINEEVHTRMIHIPDGEAFIVQPGEFILGATSCIIKVPDNLTVRVEGRSSLGRLGIIVHSTAGFIDPGFEGTITLEISNLNRLPIALYPGMRVGQFAFEMMSSPCETPYGSDRGSKYKGQIEPKDSQIFQDREFIQDKEAVEFNS